MDGWNVSFDFKGEGTLETHAVCDANGKIVAFAVDHTDKAFADLNTDHVSLIAAAPELLETLRHVEGALIDITCERTSILKGVRAAIAKATGKQP
jgi:hypothetical protein